MSVTRPYGAAQGIVPEHLAFKAPGNKILDISDLASIHFAERLITIEIIESSVRLHPEPRICVHFDQGSMLLVHMWYTDPNL